ncbi:MAG: hypothetical protein ACK40G_10890 [Cytophagaceae bacterium]
MQTVAIKEVVNQLLQACQVRIKGFKRSADYAKMPRHEELFLAYVQQSSQFLNELKPYLEGEFEEDQQFKLGKSTYKGWTGPMSGHFNSDIKGIFLERLDTEECIKEIYFSALQEELPNSLHKLIYKQYSAIMECCDAMRIICNSL